MAEFANPFVDNTPDRKMDNNELIRAVRMNLAAEEEATNTYLAHADATNDNDARKVLTSIANEERVHAGEFQRLLEKLSPSEREFLDRGGKEVDNITAGVYEQSSEPSQMAQARESWLKKECLKMYLNAIKTGTIDPTTIGEDLVECQCGKPEYTVVDSEFNRSYYPSLIGQRFYTPPSYVQVSKVVNYPEMVHKESLKKGRLLESTGTGWIPMTGESYTLWAGHVPETGELLYYVTNPKFMGLPVYGYTSKEVAFREAINKGTIPITTPIPS